jgi:hypothetical protein
MVLEVQIQDGQSHRFGLLARMVSYVRECKSGYGRKERGRGSDREERGEERKERERKREREKERKERVSEVP